MDKVTQLPTALVFLIDNIGDCLQRAREVATVEEARSLVDDASSMLSIVKKLNAEALAEIGRQG